jgi:hypothetical protein
MHYFFIDESYPPGNDERKIVMAGWAVHQAKLNRNLKELTDLYRPPVVEQIASMLERLDGMAVIGTARLSYELFRSGEIDRTDDVTSMARSDNIWSQCAIFVVGALIRALLHAGQEVDTVDIHFDPKSLKVDHGEAFEGTLRQRLVSEAKRYADERGFHLLTRLRIRRVQPVTKATKDQRPSKFQIGTWVADKLCSNAESIRANGGTSRIKTHDMSDVVRRTVQQFDGKSFHDD